MRFSFKLYPQTSTGIKKKGSKTNRNWLRFPESFNSRLTFSRFLVRFVFRLILRRCGLSSSTRVLAVDWPAVYKALTTSSLKQSLSSEVTFFPLVKIIPLLAVSGKLGLVSGCQLRKEAIKVAGGELL